MELLLKSLTTVANGVVALELVPQNGQTLPAFTAGAHIDLHLGNSLLRSYSLVNPPHDSGRYVVAVNRDPASRGGSAYIHDSLCAGQVIEVTGPRNNFELVENAPEVVFISGGIGITPMWCMIQHLESIDRPWQLFYSARSRDKSAYLQDILTMEAQKPGRVHVHVDDEAGGKHVNLAAIVEKVAPDSHVYCCGPVRMLQDFEELTASRTPGTAHIEYFSAKQEAVVTGGFKVSLARSKRDFIIPPGKSILDTLLDGGIDVQHACKEGVCGACQTAVLCGSPDHRDSYLTPSEIKSGKTMILCCSGSNSEELVLDI